jgi:hypothetical protein
MADSQQRSMMKLENNWVTKKRTDDISKNDWAIVAKMTERVTKSKKWLSHWKSMDKNLKIADEIEKWLSH